MLYSINIGQWVNIDQVHCSFIKCQSMLIMTLLIIDKNCCHKPANFLKLAIVLGSMIKYRSMVWMKMGACNVETGEALFLSLLLEQLERLRSEDTPCRLMITHTIKSYWIPSQKKTKSKLQIWKICQKFFWFWNGHYMWHTFWSCLIICAKMKWIRWVLLKIQSGHGSVHRRTDGQGDTSIPPFQLVWSKGYNKITVLILR